MHGFESIIILRTVVEAHENIRAGQPGEISGQQTLRVQRDRRGDHKVNGNT